MVSPYYRRRGFLKTAGKAAAFGLGAFLSLPRFSEGAVNKSGTSKETRPKDFAAKEKEIVDSISEKLAILERALQEHGQKFESKHESIQGLQVGKPDKDGTIAWFTIYGFIHVGLEEWSRLTEKEFQMRYWRFRFKKSGGKYTLGPWTWGKTTAPESFASKEVYEAPLDPGQEESSGKLNLALEMLIKEFDRPSPP